MAKKVTNSWYKVKRESALYNIRRKLQLIASKILSPETLSKIYYRIVIGDRLNLRLPKTFNEKLQWLKLYSYPNNDTVIRCSDKYSVREYITKKGYGNLLVPMLGVWEDANDIEFEKLPQKFVLKCNHGCAYNILCPDKDTLDKQQTVKQLNAWLKEDFGAFNLEIHYSKIQKRLITCEAFLGEKITDYKFYCFNGEPKFFYISNDLIHDREAEIGFFYLDGTKMPLVREDYKDIPFVSLPSFFGEMVTVAKALCQDFPFVRVDFFLANKRYYFAELTFIPAAGLMPFNPKEQDLEWGKMLSIDFEMNEAKRVR